MITKTKKSPKSPAFRSAAVLEHVTYAEGRVLGLHSRADLDFGRYLRRLLLSYVEQRQQRTQTSALKMAETLFKVECRRAGREGFAGPSRSVQLALERLAILTDRLAIESIRPPKMKCLAQAGYTTLLQELRAVDFGR